MTLWGTVDVHSRSEEGGGAAKLKQGNRDFDINDVNPIYYFNDKPSEELGGCNIFEWILDHKGTIYPGAGNDLSCLFKNTNRRGVILDVYKDLNLFHS